MNRREFLFSLTMLLPSFSLADDRPRCSVCGMFVEEKAAISFVGEKDGKATPFCSFTCALAFHRKYPDASLKAFDYHNHQAIPAEKAYYIIRSEKLAKEYKLAMAPVVIAFATEPGAKLAREKVKEGEILAGFSAVAKEFGR